MLTRREFLSGAAAVAAGFPAIAQSRPLRIGALISQADARGQDEMIQPYDQQMKLGLELAISEINGAGGILNRQVELLIADDDGSPAPGANAALSMIKSQGVEALVSGFVVAIRSYLDAPWNASGSTFLSFTPARPRAPTAVVLRTSAPPRCRQSRRSSNTLAPPAASGRSRFPTGLHRNARCRSSSTTWCRAQRRGRRS